MTITEPGTLRRETSSASRSLAFGILLLLAGLGAQHTQPRSPCWSAPACRTRRSRRFGIPQAVIATIATALGVAASQQQSVRAWPGSRLSRRGIDVVTELLG